MDWIKIKVHHILFTGLTPSEKGMLIMIQALTAHLERIPTEKEIIALPGLSNKAFKKLSESLCNIDVDLSEVLRKVIEDVSDVAHKRSLSKERQRKLRSKSKDVTRDVTVTSHKLPIRADKSREDNIIKEKASLKESSNNNELLANNYQILLKEKLQKLNISIFEFERIVDKVISLRKNVKNKEAFKLTLVKSFLKNSCELQGWYDEVRASEEIQNKKKQQQQNEDDYKKAQELKDIEIQNEKRQRNMDMEVFNNLPEKQKMEVLEIAINKMKELNPYAEFKEESEFAQVYIIEAMKELSEVEYANA